MILKRKNVTVNKRRIKITSRRKSMSYLREKNPNKSLLKIKISEKSEIIVIIQVNIEPQHIVFVI